MRILKKGMAMIFYLAAVFFLAVSIYIFAGLSEYTEMLGIIIFGISFLALALGSCFMMSYLFVKKDRMKVARITLKLMLSLYIIFILYITLFCRQFRDPVNMVQSFGEISTRLQHEANYTPLHTIRNYIDTYNGVTSSGGINLIGNICVFIPFGFLSTAVFRSQRRLYVFIPVCVLFIIALEFLQIIRGVGIFDVDDVILNLIGGIIGWIIAVLPPVRRQLEKTKYRRY